MKLKLFLSCLFLTPSLLAQNTTTTNCTRNGDQINCTSTTTDWDAINRRNYEAGQQAGAALGLALNRGIAAMHERHSINKRLKEEVQQYCSLHPRDTWASTDELGRDHSGRCK